LCVEVAKKYIFESIKSFINTNSLPTNTMQTITLSAAHADVNGALIIMDTPLAHTIHYWNNTDDTISWDCDVTQPGNYLVKLNYSLDKVKTNPVIQIRVGDHTIVSEAYTTESWLLFREFDAGVVTIKQAGRVRVELKGLKLPISDDGAFPDIHTVSLEQTADPSV
jgi:hypothetical protein